MRRNRTYRQKRAASSTAMITAPKRRRTVRGLVPRYAGFAPRNFSLGEWKFLDLHASFSVSTTPALILVNGMQQGTSASTRVGSKIAIRSLEYRSYLQSPSGTGDEQLCRIMFILDRQPNGAAPTAITDILVESTVTSPRNLANRKRFKIMWDKTYTIGDPAGENVNTGCPTSRFLKFYMKFRRPIVVDYNSGNAGTIADISTNSVYMCTVGTSIAGNGAAAGVYFTRIRFTDM